MVTPRQIVCSVYYSSIASMTDRVLIELKDYHDTTRYWREFRWSDRGYTLTEAQATEKRHVEGMWFKTKFVDHVRKGWYYQFIVTTQQLPIFMEDIEKFDFIKYKVYQTSVPGVNYNYPDEGPKLHAFLFYIPEE